MLRRGPPFSEVTGSRLWCRAGLKGSDYASFKLRFLCLPCTARQMLRQSPWHAGVKLCTSESRDLSNPLLFCNVLVLWMLRQPCVLCLVRGVTCVDCLIRRRADISKLKNGHASILVCKIMWQQKNENGGGQIKLVVRA